LSEATSYISLYDLYGFKISIYEVRFTTPRLRPEAKPNGAKLITSQKKIPKE